MKTYFDIKSGMGFIKVWISAIVIFFVLNLTFAIFSPIMNQVFSDLVDQYAWNNAALLSAKTLTLGFFNLFPYIMSFMILVWSVVSSLRREEDTYRR
jgi:type IV secretory pathway TrbL component